MTGAGVAARRERHTTRTTRLAALAMIVGAVVMTGCGIAQIVGPLAAGQPGFGLRNTVVAIGQLLLLAGLVGLWRSGAAGRGRLGSTGLVAAAVASGMLVVAELVEPFSEATAIPVYSAAGPLLGVGMVLTGSAVLRARLWTGWRRFTPLVCGLYAVLVLLPALAVSGGPSFVALTVFSLCWLALGAALWASATTVRPLVGSSGGAHVSGRAVAGGSE